MLKKSILMLVWVAASLLGVTESVLAQTYINPQTFVSGSAGAAGSSTFQYANGVNVTFQSQEVATTRRARA